jgi:CysZ protein
MLQVLKVWKILNLLLKGEKMNILLKTLSIIRREKVLIIYAIIPVLIGLFLYGLAGSWVFNDLLPWTRDYIEQLVAGRIDARWIYYFVVGVIGIMSFFLVNWTFVLVVGLLSMPFNDVIAGHVLKKVYGLHSRLEGRSFLSRSKSLIINELKKIIFVMIALILSMLLGVVPFLIPVSIVLSMLLVFVSLSDYAWSRLDWSATECFHYIRKDLVGHIALGALFIILLSIPGINLFALPFGVVAASVRLGELKKEETKKEELNAHSVEIV